MKIKQAIKAWLAKPIPYGKHGRTYTRGENIMYTAICLAALPVLLVIGFLVMVMAGSTLAHESAGSLVGHGVKLAILGLL
ncbi:hypothetical protein [Paraburkholderia youngii]|uniref:hypothetical protein n=1 Tax=Paraburkholderia youngii TaxID=2782701 RepID=UPI003D234891